MKIGSCRRADRKSGEEKSITCSEVSGEGEGVGEGVGFVPLRFGGDEVILRVGDFNRFA